MTVSKVAGAATPGFSAVGEHRGLQVKLTPADENLRIGRQTKFTLQIHSPAPEAPEEPTGLLLEAQPSEPAVRKILPDKLRFTFSSPDRGFTFVGPGVRQGEVTVAEGESVSVELQAIPVKRQAQVRLSLYTAKDLDLVGDYDLTFKVG